MYGGSRHETNTYEGNTHNVTMAIEYIGIGFSVSALLSAGRRAEKWSDSDTSLVRLNKKEVLMKGDLMPVWGFCLT